MARVAWSFGPFHLDERSHVLSREGERVPITDRQARVLLTLASHAGTLLSKDVLVVAGWGDVSVTDNSVEKAISLLRRALGCRPDGGPYIETVARRGYRFVGDVHRVAARESPAAIDALLVPPRIWQDGRVALETLACAQVPAAQRAFRQILSLSPDDAPAHVGLATACAFQFESTRVDLRPDTDALTEARRHADEACRLDSESAEAWATLAFVLSSAGEADRAVAAARRAVSLEPTNWRHALRLAVVSWGDVRLRAATRTLQLLPGLGLAHWLAATVHVARQAFEAAMRELDAGIAAQQAQQGSAPRFGAVGLHWLRGLVQLSLGDYVASCEAFQRELAFERAGHLYSRECCANTWYALGALHARTSARDEALAAFDEALRRVEGHPLALAAKAVLVGDMPGPTRDADHQDSPVGLPWVAPLDAALAQAVRQAWAGYPDRAAAVVQAMLSAVAPGSAGWQLPIEPMLNPSAHPPHWTPVLTLVRNRAA
jgi:DNA-binding winged helix-turn-helix (wHTH) protein